MKQKKYFVLTIGSLAIVVSITIPLLLILIKNNTPKTTKDAQSKVDSAARKENVIIPTKKEGSKVSYNQIPTIKDVNPPTKSGVTFKFKSATIVNNDGESTFTYITNVDPIVDGTTSKDVTFVVDGFETKVDFNKKEKTKTAQAKIDSVVRKESVTTPNKKEGSKVGYNQIPTIKDINPPTKNGVTFKFKSATIVNNDGESTLTYTVDVNPIVNGTTSKDVTFVVDGFKTKVEFNEKEKIKIAQAKIDDAKSDATAPTKKDDAYVAYNTMPTTKHVNLPTKIGLAFAFKSATAVNDNGQSTLTYIVNVDPVVNGTTPKDAKFVVDDFETKVEFEEKEKTKTAQDKIDSAVKKEGVTAPTKKEGSKVGYNQIPTSENVNPPIKGGITFELKLATAVNDNGQSTLTYTVNVNPIVDGTTSKEVTFEVTIFKSRVVLPKLNAINNIKSAFIKAIQHADKKLASDLWIRIVAIKVDAILTIQNNSNLEQIIEIERNKIIEIQEAIKLYNNQLLKEIETKMKGGKYQYEKLPNGFTIPSGVIKIYRNAFKGATLPNGFTIPNGVTKIGTFAFNGAILPNKFAIPNSVNIIDKSAFLDAQLPTGFTIPSEVKKIRKDAFRDVKVPLWNRWFDQDDNELELNEAIAGATLKKATNITRILDNEFRIKKLPIGFTIPNTVTTIGESAFQSAKLPNDFTIPSSITSIGELAFAGVKLTTKFILPKNLKIIGIRAFKGVKLPTGFTIPSGVKFDIISPFGDTEVPLWNRWFDQDDNELGLNKAIAGATLKKATNITRILNNEFEDKELPTEFIIPDTVKIIGNLAFKNATLPIGFTIPDSVTSIGAFAFAGVTLPIGFTIPSSITRMGHSAFKNATLPTGFKIPKGDRFRTLNIFKDVKVPLWNRWFDQDNNQLNKATTGATLKKATNITKILDYEFKWKKLPAEFTIPDTVTTIGKSAFESATLPDDFTIPSSVKSIGEEAFKDATFPDGTPFSGD